MSRAVLILLWAVASTAPVDALAAGTSSAGDDRAALIAAGLVSEVKSPQEPDLDLALTLLRLPQTVLEMAFSPLYPVLYAFERWDLFGRVVELLSNDAGTMALVPVIDPLNGSGPGFGAAFVYNEPIGSADRVVLFALMRTNRDRQLSASFKRRVPAISGREMGFSAAYFTDHDADYFGLGAESKSDGRRLLRIDEYEAELSLNVVNPAQTPEYAGYVRLGYRHRGLHQGEGTLAPPLLAEGAVVLPAGYGEALDYPELGFQMVYDTRDSFGRTTRGLVASVDTLFNHDVNGGETGTLRTVGSVSAFIPVLPRFRVLFLQLGAGANYRLGQDDDVPLHSMISLGGNKTLRGYLPDRWQGPLGWWATAEYRYQFYDYIDSGVSVSGALFVDAGHVGSKFPELVQGPFPWSVGFSLRLEQTLIMLGRLQFAYSPEGFRISIGVGDLP